ncbi:hypothetical protein HO133_000592 [Letharia lupina]|uniref:SprT-like domain-containing protein n=1 Tax=Letharia lupina TaxID=560253 RepID=A0A8H6CIB6_9LECA|nr:uncharacterized protein HO133_000592 [Letharia lupina]KAF6223749.1 hypothetical protein HO133_000592 [Letharia lupina]
MPTKSGKELYREAFLKVKADRGTPYDVSQEELDAMSTFSDRNFGPFVSQTQATKEVVDHNKPSRKPSSAELAAIQRLRSALKDSLWSPDIFQWRTPDAFVTHVQPEDFALGATVGTGRVGQMSIMLHAHNLLLRDVIRDPWMHMWSTALHEMCHAYEGVRAQTGMRAGHQMDFGFKVQAVHERAQGLFGLWAIVPAEELARWGLYQV